MALEDDEIMIDELAVIARKVMEEILPPDTYFMPEKVNTWCQQILDQCLKEYSKMNKPFKFVVTCFIMQRNGAGFQCASTCFWDTKTDGIISVNGDFPHLNCLVTIYAVHV